MLNALRAREAITLLVLVHPRGERVGELANQARAAD
jgi:hypothetical protein